MKRTVKLAFAAISLLALGPVNGAEEQRIPAKGFAVFDKSGQFKPYEFSRRPIGDNDIQIEILYAGICHSDLHHVHSDWGEENYPMVPGHEIVGRVVKVGKDVQKFAVGDYAGIGCKIGSCGTCEMCTQGLEQYCEKGSVDTYHGTDLYHENEPTQGGYSNVYVVPEKFAIKVPENAQMEKVAPLMCAGITSYSPIRFSNVKKGDRVGIAGFGGLGHMGVQYAVSLGADVTVFDVTESKRNDALRLGAKKYVNVNHPEELKGLDNSFDFILSTVPAKYDMNMYLKMLKYKGEFCVVGLPALSNMPSLTPLQLLMQGNRKVYGSQIGGIQQTQEMLDYSVRHNIYPEVEIINADEKAISDAYKNVSEGKVKFRYVIDMKTLK